MRIMNLTQTRWDERIADVQVELFRRDRARRLLLALGGLSLALNVNPLRPERARP